MVSSILSGNSDRRITRWPPHVSYVVSVDASTNLPYTTLLDATTEFQRRKIGELNLHTIGDVLLADESTFRKARGVGPVYARRIHNAAQAAVLEYLSG